MVETSFIHQLDSRRCTCNYSALLVCILNFVFIVLFVSMKCTLYSCLHTWISMKNVFVIICFIHTTLLWLCCCNLSHFRCKSNTCSIVTVQWSELWDHLSLCCHVTCTAWCWPCNVFWLFAVWCNGSEMMLMMTIMLIAIVIEVILLIMITIINHA